MIIRNSPPVYLSLSRLEETFPKSMTTLIFRTKLQRHIKRISEPGDTFLIVWIRLIYLLVSMSSRHHDDIREKVRKCSPSDYPQENLEMMIDDLKISVEVLICANQFDVALMAVHLSQQHL